MVFTLEILIISAIKCDPVGKSLMSKHFSTRQFYDYSTFRFQLGGAECKYCYDISKIVFTIRKGIYIFTATDLLQLIVERYSYYARAQDRSSVPGCPRRDELSVITQAEGATLASNKFRFGEHNSRL